MASAQVKIQDLKNGINACGVCTHELQLTAQQLLRRRHRAAQGEAQDGFAVVQFGNAEVQLENCQKWLQELAALVEKYET